MNTKEIKTRLNISRNKTIITFLIVLAISAVVAVNIFGPSARENLGKINIIAVIPFSGKGASHGEYFREGAKMYFNDHPNSHIQLKLVNSESDPQKAVSGFQQEILLQKPIAAISLLSPVSDALAPIAESNKILLIGINTATNTFVNNFQYTQRINDRPIGHTAPIARIAAKKYKKVGVIFSNDSFGLVCKSTFETTFHEKNSNDLYIEPYNPTDRDQNIVVQRLLSKKPEAIFVAGYGQAYISIFQTLRTFKYSGQIFADIDFSNPEVLKALGHAAEGVIFAAMDFNVNPPSDSLAAAFLIKYGNEFKKEPWLGSAFAYDALAIMDHLQNAKKPLDRKSFYNLKNWRGVAAQLSFPSQGECLYEFSFVRRSNGKNILIKLDEL